MAKSEKTITLLSEEERDSLMSALQAQNPNPKSELNYSDTFELLCAVVLSAQATDVSVNKVTPALFKAAPDAASMAALGEERIGEMIKTVGLWKSKARHLAALAEILDKKYQGKVPSSLEELTALPGVGSKTARVVLNVAFGLPYIAVDTHIFRVCNRTGLCLGKSPTEVEKRLPPLIKECFLKDAHHYILLHGRYVCTARNYEKNCGSCVIRDLCMLNTKGIIPDTEKKAASAKAVRTKAGKTVSADA